MIASLFSNGLLYARLDVPDGLRTIMLPSGASPVRIRRFDFYVSIEGMNVFMESLSENFTERVMSRVRQETPRR